MLVVMSFEVGNMPFLLQDGILTQFQVAGVDQSAATSRADPQRYQLPDRPTLP